MCHSPSHFMEKRSVRSGMVVPLYCLTRVAIRQLDLVDGVAHLHDGVHRAFFSTRHIAGHIDHWLQILAIDAGIDRGLLQIRHFLQRDLTAGRRRQLEVFEILDRRAIRARQPHLDRNVFARLRDHAAGRRLRPLSPTCSVRVTSAGETPCSAALSRSTFKSYLVCGSSTYQSTSTTPGVC